MHIESNSQPSTDLPPPYASETESESALALNLYPDPSTKQLLITLTPPSSLSTDKNKRGAVDICCVIDVSGSMDSEAPIPGDGGVKESTGLSVLDVVKHSIRTIVTTMKEG